MSNRDALRKLSKKFPPPKEVKDIMDALRGESDRTAAIVAASILESTLERILIAAMKHKEPRLIGQMFENRGPLSDFNGKILISMAFGVISPATGEHFQIIRHVRNAFAHARVPITFETPQVRKEIDSFGMLKAMQKVFAELDRPPETVPPLGEMPGKSAYLMIVSIMLILLDSEHRRRGHPPLYDDGYKPKPASK